MTGEVTDRFNEITLSGQGPVDMFPTNCANTCHVMMAPAVGSLQRPYITMFLQMDTCNDYDTGRLTITRSKTEQQPK